MQSFKSAAGRGSRLLIVLALALVALPIVLLSSSSPVSAGPLPVFSMLVPMEEQDISDALIAIAPGGTSFNDLVTTIDMTSAADGSVIYWDHWEDGYEADIANPTQSTTEVWGGGESGGTPLFATEFTPGATNYEVDAGTVIFLQNTVALPRVVSDPPLAAQIFFDGRDRVAATRGFSMTRAGWDSNVGTLHAGAVATTDLSKYGTQFDIPVGENIGEVAFDYTGMSVMASDDNTFIEIDTDGDGDVDITDTLAKGETHFENGGINAGATVQTSKPSQVHLITGERGSNYEGRWFEIFPRGDGGTTLGKDTSTEWPTPST